MTAQDQQPDHARPLASLTDHPRNAKLHDLDAIAASLRRFGWQGAITITAEGRILAGHGRVAVLRWMRSCGEPPPEGIAATDDDWLVPAVVSAEFDDEIEEAAYVVADNYLTLAGGWDETALTEALADTVTDTGSLEGLGFSQTDFLRRHRTKPAPLAIYAIILSFYTPDEAAAAHEDLAATYDEVRTVDRRKR